MKNMYNFEFQLFYSRNVGTYYIYITLRIDLISHFPSTVSKREHNHVCTISKKYTRLNKSTNTEPVLGKLIVRVCEQIKRETGRIAEANRLKV